MKRETTSAYSLNVLKVCHGLSRLGRTEFIIIELGAKINGVYYCDVLFGQCSLPGCQPSLFHRWRNVHKSHSSGTMLRRTERPTQLQSPHVCTRFHPIVVVTTQQPGTLFGWLYEIWGLLQRQVCRTRINSVDHLIARPPAKPNFTKNQTISRSFIVI